MKEPIKNTRILALISQIVRMEGSYDYCFGSRIIISQVKQWLKLDGEGIESSDSDDKSDESISLEDNSDKQEIKEDDGEEIEDSNNKSIQKSKKIKLENIRKKRLYWSREMKRQLLEIFIRQADNPLIKGRAQFRKQLQQISQDSDNSVTILCSDGQQRDLEELGFDSMAQMLYKTGIEKCSVGLVSYIDQWIEKIEGIVTKRHIREGASKILQIFDSK